jgi:hypothetical protein
MAQLQRRQSPNRSSQINGVAPALQLHMTSSCRIDRDVDGQPVVIAETVSVVVRS